MKNYRFYSCKRVDTHKILILRTSTNATPVHAKTMARAQTSTMPFIAPVKQGSRVRRVPMTSMNALQTFAKTMSSVEIRTDLTLVHAKLVSSLNWDCLFP